MKIAYISADLGIPVFGNKGASIHVQEVIRALHRQGATVELFTPRLGGEPPDGLEDVVVHTLPAIRKGEPAQREAAALAANEALHRALASTGPFDLIYERYSLWSYAGMEFARDRGIPGLLEVNAPLIEEQAKHRSLVDQAGAQAVAERVFGAATVLLPVSAGVAAYLNNFREAQGRIHVLPNGVDPTRFGKDVEPALPHIAGTFTVGFVGTLKAWHGLDVLVDAFTLLKRAYPSSRLLIVGDGPCRESMTETLEERGLLADAHFTGAVDPEQIPTWLASMDAAVAPYPDLENFYFSPLKVYEYMAASLPTVASNIGQLTDLIEDGVNGLLCPPGDARALAEALGRLQADPWLAAELGEAARRTIRANHTWNHVARQILEHARVASPVSEEQSTTESEALPSHPTVVDEPAKGEPELAIPNAAKPAKQPPKPENIRQSLPSLWRIFSYFRRQIAGEWPLLIGTLCSLLVGIVLRLLEPWPLKLVVDYISGEPLHNLPTAVANWLQGLDANFFFGVVTVTLLLVTAGRAVTGYTSTVGLALAGNRVLARARRKLYAHMLHLSMGFHQRSKSGDLLTHLIGDITRLQEVAVTAMLPLAVSILTLVGMVGMMFWLNWQLALLAIAVFPIVSLLMARLSGQIRTVAREQRKREGALAANAAEALGAIRVVQAFGLEEQLENHFSAQDRKNLKEGARSARLSASLERGVDLFIGASTALVLWFGARLVLSGALTLGDLVIFLSYLKSAFRPMNDLAKYTSRIAKAAASGERVLAILDTPLEIRDSADAQPAPRFRGQVTFDEVTFGYTPDQPILQEASFEVKPGQQVALVGPSGAGKSTLVSLLLRLYDPTAGRVCIDGQDIRSYTVRSLREQISIVLQESVLFGVSVRDNIAYGASDVSQAELEQAARLANAHDFIMALPNGYDTILGERGATLSGGQRQRLAIARAAVRRAPILILDEPTVSLDQENEHLVREALTRLAAGRTTFLVTHDLYAVEEVDLILFIDEGIVAERGTHAELMQLNGKYAALYHTMLSQRHTEPATPHAQALESASYAVA